MTEEEEARFEGWWRWFALVLFVLLTLDMLTTMVIVVQLGVDVESNPFMRYLYGEGALVVLLVNLVALIVAAVSFRGVVDLSRRISPPYDRLFKITVEVWLALMLVLGLFVFANNLSVILRGESLL